jgi:hypothetical protein
LPVFSVLVEAPPVDLSGLRRCVSLDCARSFGFLNALVHVSFKFLFSISTQFTLPLDLLEKLENLGSDRIMMAQERH